MRYLSLDQCLLIACSVAGIGRETLYVVTHKGNYTREKPAQAARTFYVFLARTYTTHGWIPIWRHIYPGVCHTTAIGAYRRCREIAVFHLYQPDGTTKPVEWPVCERILVSAAAPYMTDVEAKPGNPPHRPKADFKKPRKRYERRVVPRQLTPPPAEPLPPPEPRSVVGTTSLRRLAAEAEMCRAANYGRTA